MNHPISTDLRSKLCPTRPTDGRAHAATVPCGDLAFIIDGMTHLRGRFLVFDGGEGCGKSTQAKLLAEKARSSGIEVLLVRDPGTTRIGELIRNILLNPDHDEMAMRCEMLLYMSARAQMMAETIRPALERNALVLSDRFVSSTLAYQLGGDGLTADEIRTVARIALKSRMPDFTIILDMPVNESIARVKRAKDRIEQRPIEYHEQVRRNYLAQVSAESERHLLIPANQPIELVHAAVVQAMERLR
jgi:dTMP kinase